MKGNLVKLILSITLFMIARFKIIKRELPFYLGYPPFPVTCILLPKAT